MSDVHELHVIFGTGPLGQSVMRALLARGKQVRMVNRSGKAAVAASVEVSGGNAYDPVFTWAVTRGAAVVYQCAQPRYTEWATRFPPLQAAILQGAAQNNARMVIGDNLYMYGEVDGPIHEGLPNAARTRKGNVRARMAEAALQMHAEGSLRVAIGRGSDFYGPGVLGSVVGERIFANIVAGKAVQGFGNINLPHTYTFIDDFGEALAVLGEHDEAFGQVWHVPNAETLSSRQFFRLAYGLAGQSARISSMGRLMLAIGGLFIPEAREMVEMTYEFEKPYVVDSGKFIHTFGDCSTSLRAALAKTLDWYKIRRPAPAVIESND